MKLLYGTGNQAKLNSMKEKLKGLDIEIAGLKEMSFKAEEPEETGNNPLENARIKALYYYGKYNQPTFSCDTGLFIEGLSKEQQPGVFVRRVQGNTLTDEEMISYYSKLAEKLGGKARAKYKNAICLVLDAKNVICYDGEDICWKDFWIVDKPFPTRNPGFPLDSISVDIGTGKYFIDTSYEEDENEEANVRNGFRNFFIRSLSKYKTL